MGHVLDFHWNRRQECQRYTISLSKRAYQRIVSPSLESSTPRRYLVDGTIQGEVVQQIWNECLANKLVSKAGEDYPPPGHLFVWNIDSYVGFFAFA